MVELSDFVYSKDSGFLFTQRYGAFVPMTELEIDL